MPALVASIHVFFSMIAASKTWMAGTSPAMTRSKQHLLQLRARALDHVGPLGDLVPDQHAEFLRGAAGGLVADHAEALEEGRRRDDAIERRVELHHDIARHAGRPD